MRGWQRVGTGAAGAGLAIGRVGKHFCTWARTHGGACRGEGPCQASRTHLRCQSRRRICSCQWCWTSRVDLWPVGGSGLCREGWERQWLGTGAALAGQRRWQASVARQVSEETGRVVNGEIICTRHALNGGAGALQREPLSDLCDEPRRRVGHRRKCGLAR